MMTATPTTQAGLFRGVLGCLVALTAALILVEMRGQGAVSEWVLSGSSNLRRVAASTSTTAQQQQQQQQQENRPTLSSLIDFNITNHVIKGNVEFLLDFAIIGHPKTATSFTMDWLSNHNEIKMYNHELHSLQSNKPAEFVKLMYELPQGSQYKRGYKAPRDIANVRALDLLAEYWPKAKLIVGLRHPVLWFESFYNFRVRQGYTMAPAHHPVFFGTCTRESHGVCTHEANFHHHLALMGKTSMSSEEELSLFLPEPPRRRPYHDTVPNEIFLYEITQLYSKASRYRNDLAEYLGLKNCLSPIIRAPKGSNSTNTTNTTALGNSTEWAGTGNSTSATGTDSAAIKVGGRRMNICDEKYKPLRDELIRNGSAASKWIRTYFLGHPDVTVSSPAYFRELLLTWLEDPCDTRE